MNGTDNPDAENCICKKLTENISNKLDKALNENNKNKKSSQDWETKLQKRELGLGDWQTELDQCDKKL